MWRRRVALSCVTIDYSSDLILASLAIGESPLRSTTLPFLSMMNLAPVVQCQREQARVQRTAAGLPKFHPTSPDLAAFRCFHTG